MVRKVLTEEQVAQLGDANGNITGFHQPLSEGNGSLQQNYPNPFAVSTTFPYTIQQSGDVTFKVLDLTGKQIDIISVGNKTPGNYQLEINRSKLVDGIYYLQMLSNSQIYTRKMIIID
mgnify:FL=1